MEQKFVEIKTRVQRNRTKAKERWNKSGAKSRTKKT